jgi:hypothetical protein
MRFVGGRKTGQTAPPPQQQYAPSRTMMLSPRRLLHFLYFGRLKERMVSYVFKTTREMKGKPASPRSKKKKKNDVNVKERKKERKKICLRYVPLSACHWVTQKKQSV